MYTTQEKIEIVKLRMAGNSYQRVSDLFSALYPNSLIPNKATIFRICKKFNGTGSVKNEIVVRTKRILTNDIEIAICAAIENDCTLSCRGIAEELNVSHVSVQKVLKSHGYKNFKVQKSQELIQGDKFRRTQFFELILESINRNELFLKNILFTDESSFSLTNRHNPTVVRYWSKENKHLTIPSHTQYRQKLNAWAGLIGNHVIGPFFINGTLTSQKYLDILQFQVFPALQQLDDIAVENIYFQQDGCPAHNALPVRNWLSQQFPNRWIGTHSQPISWPARSPDLSPLDFFYWGHLKNTIYGHVRPNNLQELQERIVGVSQNITQETLNDVSQDFYHRLGFCLAQEGGIFENML